MLGGGRVNQESTAGVVTCKALCLPPDPLPHPKRGLDESAFNFLKISGVWFKMYALSMSVCHTGVQVESGV